MSLVKSIADFSASWKYESESTAKVFGNLTDKSLNQKVTEEGRSLGFIAWHITQTIGEMMSKAGLSFEGFDENAPLPAEAEKIKGKVLTRKNDNFFVGGNEEFRYLPENVIIPSTTWTWADKTGIFVWNEPYYCILITSKEIASSNVATFTYLFEMAQKPSLKDIQNRLLKD